MVTISVATSRKYYDSTGSQREQTTWHTVNLFSKIGEIAKKYVEVGELVAVIGEVLHNKINDERGTRWFYSVTASEIKLLPNGKKKEKSDTDKEEPVDDFDDDILPF